MFRPPQKNLLPFPDQNNLSYEHDFRSVKQFISNNKAIPANLDSFAKSPEDLLKIKQLQSAIEQVDFNHPLFSNPNCQLYLDYLYQEKRISPEDYLTMHIYITALRQFTDKQPLAEQDKDVKGNASVEWSTLGNENKEKNFTRILMRSKKPKMENMLASDLVVINDEDEERVTVYWIEHGDLVKQVFHSDDVDSILVQLPEAGESKDPSVIKKLNKLITTSTLEDKLIQKLIDIHFKSEDFDLSKKNKIEVIDIKKLKAEIRKLSQLGKTVIKVKYNFQNEDERNNECSFSMVDDVAKLTPYILMQNDICYIPSASLMKLILKTLNPTLSVDMAAIYGNINSFTLYLFHQLGLHPINLYSPLVKSNPDRVHSNRCGPFAILMHDLGHNYFGNIINKNEYNFIFQYLLPTMRSLLDIKELPAPTSLAHFADLNFKNKSLSIVNPELIKTLKTPEDLHTFYFNCCIQLILNDVNAFSHNKGEDIFEKKLELLEILFKDKDIIKKKYGIDVKKMLSENPLIYEKTQMLDLLKKAEETKTSVVKLYRDSRSQSYRK